MDKIVTELITDYQKGLIDDNTFRTFIDNLATLNNTVKTKFGVDWIVYSPEEREILFTLAKLRRARQTGVV
jgi:hypothetical protein